ncbi:nucleoside hydrolase [Dentipellis sp. KUC8613]|nr:nucleoside hydrolase [Dentipellis sp. KUC8613]
MTERKKIPVIIDTDPGVDDTVAILLALASPEIEILAYVVTYGNTDVPSSYANIFKIYQAVSKHIEEHPEARARFPNFQQARKPLLIKGPTGPLEGDLHSAHYFHGRDGLGGVTERHPDLNVPASIIDAASHPQLQPVDRPAHEVALELLREFPARAITYIPLGPLTNLALMLRADAQCVRERIGRVVAMGGALDVPGNTSPVAEFNFFADPYAVAEVLTPAPDGPHAGIPLSRTLLLPLDITTQHELPFALYAARVDRAFAPAAPSTAHGKPPLAHFTSAFFQRTREIMRGFGKDAMELHDVAAVWCAAQNPPVGGAADAALGLAGGWEVSLRKFQMERIGQLTRGMCVVDRRDDKGAYAPGANRAAVQAALERQQIAHGPFESTALPAQVEVEDSSQAELQKGGGVPCVVRTPGSDKLVELMFQRIWGVEM